MSKLRVGIFFGGPSREREISFKGGKTAFEHLDKTLFEAIPIFVDSLGNFIQIDTELMYQASIRDFFPSKNLNRGYSVYIESLGKLSESQLYKLIHKIGKQVKPTELPDLIDFAFVVMHGPQCEDGAIQGLLEWVGVPYMGPGIMGSAVGIDKGLQNRLMALATGQYKRTSKVSREEWEAADKKIFFNDLCDRIGFPVVVKAPHQGSSIGVAIVRKKSVEEFSKSVQQCFFEMSITQKEWEKITDRQKKNIAQKIANLDEGIGFPLVLNENQTLINHPADLTNVLDVFLQSNEEATLASTQGEDHVIFEEFIDGREFSCGVIQDDDGTAIALPPTEIYVEAGGAFDFKSKYILNTTKKRIPIETSNENLKKVHESLLKVFNTLGFNVVTRIDGFLTPDNRIILHDPNTIPGMSPASLIFKQMAEVGLNITQSITYFIRQSVRERIRSGKNTYQLRQLLARLDKSIADNNQAETPKVAIIFGENNEEYLTAKSKFIEFASGASSFKPVLVCAAQNGDFYKIPTNLIFKDSFQDFGLALSTSKHPFLLECIDKAKTITKRFSGEEFDWQVKKWNEVNLAENAAYIFDCASQTMTEL